MKAAAAAAISFFAYSWSWALDLKIQQTSVGPECLILLLDAK